MSDRKNLLAHLHVQDEDVRAKRPLTSEERSRLLDALQARDPNLTTRDFEGVPDAALVGMYRTFFGAPPAARPMSDARRRQILGSTASGRAILRERDRQAKNK
jgi:hypothetical protein